MQFKDGETRKFRTADDFYVLDAGEGVGIDTPYSCRAGGCSTCLMKVLSGSIDQSDQSFLDDQQIADGWALSCVTYVKSDVTLLMEVEEELY